MSWVLLKEECENVEHDPNRKSCHSRYCLQVVMWKYIFFEREMIECLKHATWCPLLESIWLLLFYVCIHSGGFFMQLTNLKCVRSIHGVWTVILKQLQWATHHCLMYSSDEALWGWATTHTANNRCKLEATAPCRNLDNSCLTWGSWAVRKRDWWLWNFVSASEGLNRISREPNDVVNHTKRA